MSKFSDKEKDRRGVPQEDDVITARHLNRAEDACLSIPDLFQAQLTQRLAPQNLAALTPQLRVLLEAMGTEVLLTFFRPNAETFGELHTRMYEREAALPQRFAEQKIILDEAAIQDFRATYRFICNELERAMTGPGHAAAPLLQ